MCQGNGSCVSYILTRLWQLLDLNFDGACNSISILGQICLSSEINNEIYTLKELMQQPDNVQFEKAIYEKVKWMFNNETWIKVSKRSMFTYYDGLRKEVKDIKTHHIMMILSFKRKQHPDDRISKYKASLCCHGVQQ